MCGLADSDPADPVHGNANYFMMLGLVTAKFMEPFVHVCHVGCLSDSASCFLSLFLASFCSSWAAPKREAQ